MFHNIGPNQTEEVQFDVNTEAQEYSCFPWIFNPGDHNNWVFALWKASMESIHKRGFFQHFEHY